MCKIPNQAVTHAGRFHADDVFSTALLRILNPQIQVQRVPQLPEGFAGLAFDIGWGEFDHHQQGAPVRENGVPYAAFGLLWRRFGLQLLEAGEARRFDEQLSSRWTWMTTPAAAIRWRTPSAVLTPAGIRRSSRTTVFGGR